jgi:3-hydroxybutyryl-CoA dehydratase
MNVKPHDKFSAEYALNSGLVSEQAMAIGDDNPLHHVPEFAAATRFGRPIASGAHTTSLLLALCASHFSKGMSMAGLDFWVGFRRPIYADEKILMEWLVRRVTPNEKLGGSVVEMRGRIPGEDGKTSLGAKGRLLISKQL